jgi:hypothetical protein
MPVRPRFKHRPAYKHVLKPYFPTVPQKPHRIVRGNQYAHIHRQAELIQGGKGGIVFGG